MMKPMRKFGILFLIIVCIGSNKPLKSIKIGTQVWDIKNLEVTKFRNGVPIPQAKTDEDWKNASINKQPAWCFYNNDPINGKKYGKLYNWYAVNDSRGLAPKGWHIPTDKEWTLLIEYLGGENLASDKMKSFTGWDDYQNGSNESGFTVLPSGIRDGSGAFGHLGKICSFWSSTEGTIDLAWLRALGMGNLNRVSRMIGTKSQGLSIRCLED